MKIIKIEMFNTINAHDENELGVMLPVKEYKSGECYFVSEPLAINLIISENAIECEEDDNDSDESNDDEGGDNDSQENSEQNDESGEGENQESNEENQNEEVKENQENQGE